MSNRPKVSVCIPSYNHARYLPAAIESVLAQTYRDFEIVITDDGSTDDSVSIIQGYVARHPSLIRFFTHPGHRNLGIGATANLNLRMSRGLYWAGLCSDDVWHAEKLEQQVAFMEARPEVGLVYSLAQIINEAGEELPEVIGEDGTRAESPLEQLLMGNYIPAPTVMARRECMEQAGPEDNSLAYSDYELWIRILSHWKPGFINRPLIKYRLHGSNTSRDLPPEIHLDNKLTMMLALREKAPAVGGELQQPRPLALIDLHLAHLFFCAGDTDRALQSWASVFETDPSLKTDVEYVARWLDSRKHEIYHPPPVAPGEHRFNSWALENLPPSVPASSRRKLERLVAGQQFADAAFVYYRTDLQRARRMAVNCFMNDPRWLKDRVLLPIFLETLVGPKLMARARRLKKSLAGRAQTEGTASELI